MGLLQQISDEYISKLGTNESIFKYIPCDIGTIEYVSTTNERDSPYTKDEIRRKSLITVAIPLGISLVIWLIWHDRIILSTILTLIALTIMLIKLHKIRKFDGKDFFVGDEGFCVVTFEGKRDNITSKETILFKNLSEILTNEVYTKQNGVYTGTNYEFTFFKSTSEPQKLRIVKEANGTYHQEKVTDEIYDVEYYFYKIVEKNWTNFKLKSIDFKKEIVFNVILVSKDNDSIWEMFPYIIFKNDSIVIGGVTYNRENIKSVRFNNGNFVIENTNHSKKLFGLIEKGGMSEIPMSNVGNKKLFIALLESALAGINK